MEKTITTLNSDKESSEYFWNPSEDISKNIKDILAIHIKTGTLDWEFEENSPEERFFSEHISKYFEGYFISIMIKIGKIRGVDGLRETIRNHASSLVKGYHFDIINLDADFLAASVKFLVSDDGAALVFSKFDPSLSLLHKEEHCSIEPFASRLHDEKGQFNSARVVETLNPGNALVVSNPWSTDDTLDYFVFQLKVGG